jgi:hypothetical protein
MASQIPLYVFTGFLEAGKTKAIQETMQDKRFHDGEKTLLLLCEEGIEEYDLDKFSGGNVFVVTIENEEDLNPEYLSALQKKFKIERVIVEYNGMWLLDSLYNNLPDKWFVYQEILFVDSKTFLNYNANMRPFVVDKFTNTEMVVFNRSDESTDKDEFHKIVRGISRRCAIAYEMADGTMEYDDKEDPLPFDIDAPIIEIEDRDYALWFRDMAEDMKKYIGKTVKFKGIVAVSSKLGPNTVVCGRHVMTCCVDDIEFKGMVAILPERSMINNRDWVTITATFTREYHKLYRSKGPVLKVIDFIHSEKPEQEVATFY